MDKKANIVLYTICCVLAIYGLFILIRKLILAPDAQRKLKQDLGYSFYLEPYRQFLEVGDKPEDLILKKLVCRKECDAKCRRDFPNDTKLRNNCKTNCLIDNNC